MGGRGASGAGKHGTYGKNNEHTYGSEYHTVLKSGNIKFVIANEGSNSAPMETQTRGRVYVTVDKNLNEPKFISYYDNDNKRIKQIDLNRPHNDMLPHTHHGYKHNENDSKKGAANLTTEEKQMVDRVNALWSKHLKGK